MIPQNATIPGVLDMQEVTEQPSFTYLFDIEKERIKGYTDGQLAMKQAIYKILLTERYQWVIYSWNYGVELAELMGKPITYCVPEIKRRITEALLQDDRILDVDEFQFDLSVRETVKVKFSAHTVYGDVDAETEVPI
jgi:hypothetical protein